MKEYSRNVTVGIERAPNRSLFYALGLTKEEMERPLIGVVSSKNEELEGKQKTSADGLFTLETVACLGACGLAPVVTVNDKVHSKMSPESAIELLEELKKEEAAL